MRHLPFWENQLIMISMFSLKQVLIRFFPEAAADKRLHQFR